MESAGDAGVGNASKCSLVGFFLCIAIREYNSFACAFHGMISTEWSHLLSFVY